MLTISLGYCLCILLIYKRSLAISKEQIGLDLCLVIMVFGFFGARLAHVLYEEPQFYFNNPVEIIKFWRGGFIYYGGLIMAGVASFLYLKIKRETFGLWADLLAPIISLGYAIGRIGCFLNGCCFGKECDLPWAIEFHHFGLPTGTRHPSQLYAGLWDILLMLIVFWISRNFSKAKTFLPHGQLFLFWLFFHSLGRIIMESYRDDFRGPQALFNLSISTFISYLLATAAISIFFWRKTMLAKAQVANIKE